MEQNANRPNTRSGNVSNSPNKMSAEEKLKRSIKNLSYTSGGTGSMDLGSTAKSAKSSMTTASNDTTRRKVGGVVLDVDTIQDATKQQLQTKTKRNNVIILVLGLLLVVSLVYLAITIAGYFNAKKSPNCHYKVMGSASASWELRESDKMDFVIAPGLEPNMLYEVTSTLNIKTTSTVTLTIEVKASVDGQSILIAGLSGAHDKLVRISDDENKFVYDGSITGGGKFLMFTGIDFTDAPDNLTSDNITLEIIAHVNILQ